MPEPNPEKYLSSIMTDNKAKGMFGQAYFEKFMLSSTQTKNKYADGCWIFSPKGKGSENRMCFFAHDSVYDLTKIGELAGSLEQNRKFQALVGSLDRAGMGIFYAVPGGLDANGIVSKWGLLHFSREKFEEVDPYAFFSNWPGSRGRVSTVREGKEWTQQTIDRFGTLPRSAKIKMVINQQFVNELVKRRFKKPLDDPYDTDCFIVSYSGKVFPVEVKEKFPYMLQKQKTFGIDAGRILMMLRLCLPSKSNALYIIREVAEDRTFVKWKHTSLDRIIMNCSWQLQAGGKGMSGGDTQTIPIPYKYFEDTVPESFEDSMLEAKSELSTAVQQHARKMLEDTNSFCNGLLRNRLQ